MLVICLFWQFVDQLRTLIADVLAFVPGRAPPTYAVTSPFWQFVDHWQTLIAGVLALVAALGTVVATIMSANREVRVANAQTRLASLREQRAIAREGYAFYAIIEATMGIVIDDVNAARLLSDQGGLGGPGVAAYQIRQKVRKTGFADLRSALTRLGGELASPFLRLDKEIDEFTAQWTPFADARFGNPVGISETLQRIELQAAALREEAVNGMQRCNRILVETLEVAGIAA